VDDPAAALAGLTDLTTLRRPVGNQVARRAAVSAATGCVGAATPRSSSGS
jgi:hypothetical protein